MLTYVCAVCVPHHTHSGSPTSEPPYLGPLSLVRPEACSSWAMERAKGRLVRRARATASSMVSGRLSKACWSLVASGERSSGSVGFWVGRVRGGLSPARVGEEVHGRWAGRETMSSLALVRTYCSSRFRCRVPGARDRVAVSISICCPISLRVSRARESGYVHICNV